MGVSMLLRLFKKTSKQFLKGVTIQSNGYEKRLKKLEKQSFMSHTRHFWPSSPPEWTHLSQRTGKFELHYSLVKASTRLEHYILWK